MTDPAPGALPPPLVELKSDPARWFRNRLILTVDALVLAHLGVLIVAALYYLITQTNPSVKHWWDTTVTPASLRHDIRDVGEGVLASCLAQAIVWNPFTRGHRRAGRTFRELRERFHVPIGVAALVSAAAIGAVAFTLGELVLHWLSVRSTSHPLTGSLWNRTTTVWKSNWDKKLLGFLAAVAARRPLHVLFDEAQEYFVARRASVGAGVRWYHPPVFKARYNDLVTGGVPARHYPDALTYVVAGAVLGSIVLAGYGYYILTYQA